jgi:hypothetical protein
MKFPESCIDIRRATKVAGIVINNLMLFQKRQYVMPPTIMSVD